MTRVGKDFSSYQGNLTPAACAGLDFAYVKATEGGSYQNPDAQQQASTLRAAGVEVGFYHFFDIGTPVLDQLHSFQLMVAALGGTNLPPAIDVEQNDPSGWTDLASQVMQFATNVEGWTYPTPHPRTLLYVNQTFYDGLATAGFPWGRWVWLAYPGAAPSRPCLIWQNGQTGGIDTDVFMGSDADWAEFLGQASPPSPLPAPVPAPLPAPPTTEENEMQDSTTIYHRQNGAEYGDRRQMDTPRPRHRRLFAGGARQPLDRRHHRRRGRLRA